MATSNPKKINKKILSNDNYSEDLEEARSPSRGEGEEGASEKGQENLTQ